MLDSRMLFVIYIEKDVFVRSAPFGIVIIGTMFCYCNWLEGKIVCYRQTANVYPFDRGQMKFIYANMYKMCILECKNTRGIFVYRHAQNTQNKITLS